MTSVTADQVSNLILRQQGDGKAKYFLPQIPQDPFSFFALLFIRETISSDGTILWAMVPAGRTLILRIPRMQTANFLIKVVISRNRTDHSVFNRSTSEAEEEEREISRSRSYLRQVVDVRPHS